jgi:PEP-CTERM motif
MMMDARHLEQLSAAIELDPPTADAPQNMQWQTTQAAKAKDKVRNLQIDRPWPAPFGPIPEPSTVALFGLGLLGLPGVRALQRRKSAPTPRPPLSVEILHALTHSTRREMLNTPG